MIYRNSWNNLLYTEEKGIVLCKREQEAHWRVSNHDLHWYNLRKGTDRLQPVLIELENK